MTSLHLARKATTALRKLRGTYPIVNRIRRSNYDRGIVEVDDYDGDLRMRLDLGDHMASQIFWFGYYSRDVVAAIKARLPRGGVFIDGGANIGEITLVAAKCVGNAGRVLSFEPVPAIRETLTANVTVNGMQQAVTIFSSGLSEAVSTLPLFSQSETYSDGSHHSGLGTLYATEERPQLIGEISLTSIDATIEDQKLDRLDGIKLDIEGAELAAIRGAAGTLARFRPWLIVEIGLNTCEAAGYPPQAIFDALPGYRFGRIERGGRLVPITSADLRPWQNVMCLPG